MQGQSASLVMRGQNASLAMQGEAQELRLNHELSVQLSKEFNMRAAALKRAGEEIVELRRQLQLLQSENTRLKAKIEDEEKMLEGATSRPLPDGLARMSASDLAKKLQLALEKYREEKLRGVGLERRLEEAVKEASRGRAVERRLEDMERAHLDQNKEFQRLQDENRKLEGYRQTAQTQEKVIAKLERILESSLQEVQKAQRIQVDVERLKSENLRLREHCAKLVSQRQGNQYSGGGAEDLARQVAEKTDEVARLQALVKDMQRGAAQRHEVALANSPQLARERHRLDDFEGQRLEWERRCQAAEDRLRGVQQQLVESSKKYGAELSNLRVEVAKRDARIMELETLLLIGDKAGSSPRPPQDFGYLGGDPGRQYGYG